EPDGAGAGMELHQPGSLRHPARNLRDDVLEECEVRLSERAWRKEDAGPTELLADRTRPGPPMPERPEEGVCASRIPVHPSAVQLRREVALDLAGQRLECAG